MNEKKRIKMNPGVVESGAGSGTTCNSAKYHRNCKHPEGLAAGEHHQDCQVTLALPKNQSKSLKREVGKLQPQRSISANSSSSNMRNHIGKENV